MQEIGEVLGIEDGSALLHPYLGLGNLRLRLQLVNLALGKLKLKAVRYGIHEAVYAPLGLCLAPLGTLNLLLGILVLGVLGDYRGHPKRLLAIRKKLPERLHDCRFEPIGANGLQTAPLGAFIVFVLDPVPTVA